MASTRLRVPVRPGTIDLIDGQIQPWLRKLQGATGIVNMFVQTPGCAVSVNENCDASVRSDMLAALGRLVPGSGPEAAETRALLYGKSLSLPVIGGRIQHGTWQGIYLCSHGEAEHAEVILTFAPGVAPEAFAFQANARASHALDERVLQSLGSRAAAPGVLLVHEQHTSASLAVSEGNLEPGMSELVPEAWNREFFTHTFEGDDDMPGHLKCSLLGCSACVPVDGGRLCLGVGQRLLLNEHRNAGGWGGGHSRAVCSALAPAAGAVRSLTSAGQPVREVTREVEASLEAQEGLVALVAQDPAAGLAVCAAGAAAALATCAARAADWRCGAAIIGCSLVLPVAGGQLLLAEGTGVFLLALARGRAEEAADSACSIVVATCAGARARA